MQHIQRISILRDSIPDSRKLIEKLKSLRAQKRIYEDAYSNENPDKPGVSHKLAPLTRMILNRLLEQLDPVQEEYGGRESSTLKELDRWIAIFDEYLAIFEEESRE